MGSLGLAGCDVHPEVVCEASKPRTTAVIYRATWDRNRYECSGYYWIGSSLHEAHWCWYERNGTARDGYVVPSCGGS